LGDLVSGDCMDEAAVVISASGRLLRRQLRPLVWVTLEEVALDAVVEEGGLVARTSARQVAEHLGVDPGTVAGALRVLRQQGFLVLEREHGPAGRFGLSAYVLGSIPGMRVVPPGAAEPHVVPPDMAEPFRAPALVGRPKPPAASLQCPGQEEFDLGPVSP
jgi:hypothetical protein